MKVPEEGLLSKAYAKERAKLIDPKHASKSFIAGDPLPYDSKVKQWPYWKADVKDASNDRAAMDVSPVDRNASLGLDSAGVSKDTTHMTVIDKDGWPQPSPWKCDTLNVAPGERWDVIVDCDRPGTWAFHCHILPHVEGVSGMFGMVSTLIVVPEKAHVDAIVNAVIS